MPPRSNGFDKDRTRAVMAGKKSTKACPELIQARQLSSVQFEETVYKHIYSPIETLKKIMADPTTPAIDLMVIKIIVMAIQNGDYTRLDFLLNRTIGKVADKLEAQVGVVNLHDALIRKLEGSG